MEEREEGREKAGERESKASKKGSSQEAMHQAALGRTTSSKSALKPKPFGKGTMNAARSLCALKLKINGQDRKPMEEIQGIVCRFLCKSKPRRNVKSHGMVSSQKNKKVGQADKPLDQFSNWDSVSGLPLMTTHLRQHLTVQVSPILGCRGWADPLSSTLMSTI